MRNLLNVSDARAAKTNYSSGHQEGGPTLRALWAFPHLVFKTSL